MGILTPRTPPSTCPAFGYPATSFCLGPFRFAQAVKQDPSGAYYRMAAAWLDDDCLDHGDTDGSLFWGPCSKAYVDVDTPDGGPCAGSVRYADLDRGDWIAHLSEGR